jgi:hypothetical protein
MVSLCFGIIFVLIFSITGCSKQPADNTPSDTAIDYLTGSAQIKQGRKASQELRNIADKRDEDFKELGI